MQTVNNIEFTSEEFSIFLRAVFNYEDINGIINIDEDILDECCGENVPHLKNLYGYKIIINKDGDHKNDYQLINYNLKFISPLGKNTIITKKMCLIWGWEYGDKVIIN